MAENVATTVLGRNYCDNRQMSGYGSAWLYKEANETLYHLVVPVAELPRITGSTETFESNLLTCPNIGLIEGKASLEQVDITVLFHRDNVRKLEALEGRTLDFMFLYKDGTAITFTGKIKFDPDTAGSDLHNGVVTLTPNSKSETTILDARSLIRPTINFVDVVPERMTISATSSENVIVLKTDPTRATISAVVKNGATGETSTDFTVTISGKNVTIARNNSNNGTYYAIVILTATDTETINVETGEKAYASQSVSIAVDYTITGA